MNEAPDEEIKAAISGARDKLFKSAKCCAVPSRQLEEQFNPEILEDIAKFLEDRGLTVINKPSLTRYVRSPCFVFILPHRLQSNWN